MLRVRFDSGNEEEDKINKEQDLVAKSTRQRNKHMFLAPKVLRKSSFLYGPNLYVILGYEKD